QRRGKYVARCFGQNTRALEFGRIFALQKTGFPLQFGRFAAKFRSIPCALRIQLPFLAFNQCFPKSTLNTKLF
ncbi:MAG: hypothetical protein LBC77_06455, partial [Spirochaetaceae bacterium]|nr:hypothetical protein [Spirochaetaceae bacterium]